MDPLARVDAETLIKDMTSSSFKPYQFAEDLYKTCMDPSKTLDDLNHSQTDQMGSFRFSWRKR